MQEQEPQALFCEACNKSYRVTQEALQRVRHFAPGTLSRTPEGYRYSGGCFFKTDREAQEELRARSSP